MDIAKTLLESYENISRENKTAEETRSGTKKDVGQDVGKLLLESYENIPRENRASEEAKSSPEEEAMQGIEEMVGFLKKRVKGNFGELEKRTLEENTEKWKRDIEILRNYIQQESENR